MRTGRRLLFIPLVLLIPLLLTQVAYASPPIGGGGAFADTSLTITPVREADANTIINLSVTTDITGAFTGNSSGNFRCVIKSTGKGTCHGTETFTGTVCVDTDCRSGTVFLDDVIKIDGPVAEGRFTILSGTGGLANLHGSGIFQGTPGVGGTYTTQLHFDP